MFITETMPIDFSSAIFYIVSADVPYSMVESYYVPRFGQIWPRGNR